MAVEEEEEEAYLDLASPPPLLDADRSRERDRNGLSLEPASAAIVQPGNAVLPLAVAHSLLGHPMAEIGRMVGQDDEFFLGERGRNNGREIPFARIGIVKARGEVLALLVGSKSSSELHGE